MSTQDFNAVTLQSDEKDQKSGHLERVPDETVSGPNNALPSYKLWHSESFLFAGIAPSKLIDFSPDNAANSWWNDKGLRRCMLDIACLFGSIYANGYDSSLVTSLQANESWLLFVYLQLPAITQAEADSLLVIAILNPTAPYLA